ncbi:hypothetical protein [Pseudomonas sp. Marseille-P9899]|uniref:hypothetical protein n=1 Tax=Pseudomonas sp. Marseille-P9899 TaxID=2730401 RepID=UPI00158CA9FB|nr:hypothetical protein [Pseudomonas sp. Marseille-P9899]
MTDFNPPSDSASTPVAQLLELPAPRVTAALDPIPGGEENLLPITALSAPLRVGFDKWPTSSPGLGEERLDLLWDGRVAASKSWTAPIPDNDLFIMLPDENLAPDGPHQLLYEVVDWAGNSHRSLPLTITIDTRAPVHPGNPAKLVFPTEVIFGGITNQYLEANNNRVEATVPKTSYTFKPGDRLKGFWEEGPYGQNQVIDVELTPDLTVCFDGEMIEREGNGERVITYLLQDRAGNDSKLSLSAQLTVNILPPEPRPLVTVVQAQPGNPGEGTLDPKNTTSGVTARVPAQQDDISGATLTLHWRGFGDSGSFQTTTPSSPDGMDFKIPASAIPANMGRKVEVYYSVKWPTGEPEISATYFLTVQKLATTTMMLLSCSQAGSGKLSLASVPQGANLSMAPWPYKPLADGMRINLWVTGLDQQGASIRFDLLKAQVVPKNASPVTAVLPRADLLKLQLDKIFATRVAVSFDDGETYLDFRFLDLNLVS